MSKIGYLFLSKNLSSRESDRGWMLEHGCIRIIEEEGAHEKLRPLWKKMLADLNKGDEIFVSKLSNAVRGVHELSAFLDLCRRYGVRVVSIHDRIDSAGRLFPSTTVSDVLDMVALLPAETTSLRRSEARVFRLKKSNRVTPKTQLRLDKEKLIVNMYNAGESIDDIWSASGYKSRTSVFRVLKRSGVQLNRRSDSGADTNNDQESQ